MNEQAPGSASATTPPLVSRGATLLNQVAVLLRLAQFHDATNALLNPPVLALARTLKEQQAEAEIRIDLVADSFFVNRALVRVPGGLAEAADGLRKTYERLAIQRLAFAPTTTEADLRAFLALFQKHWHTATPSGLKDELAGPVRVATLGSAADELGMTGATIDARQHLLKCYARLTLLARDAVARVQEGHAPLTPQARRAVQALIDAAREHESLLTGLTRFPGFRGDLGCFHAAVAAHCLVMGRRLGLPKVAQVDLALAALVHRLGFAHPAHQPGVGPEESQRPPLLSLLAALADGVRADTAWHARGAFEANTPARHRDLLQPSLLARLIAVPSAFERLTSAQPPSKPVTPDQALRLLQDQAGVRFDPRVVTLFVSVVGVFPIGSMVKLDDGALAVVIDVPSGAGQVSQPVVRVVRTPAGPASYLIDLATDPSRRIVGTVDAAEEQLNPTFFLLS